MNSPQPQLGISEISVYDAVAPDFDSGVIELSQNEGPFAPSEKVIAALNAACKHLNRYPDGSGTALREAIAARFQLESDRIVCGSASDQLISMLIQAYAGARDGVLCSQYGFVFYRTAAFSHGARPIIAAETDCRVDIAELVRLADDTTKICIISNPGNPTGTYVTGEELKQLRERLPAHVLLVVDSAYAEYVTADDYCAGDRLVRDREDTVMLRTFSKIYGLAGLRLGWAYCPTSISNVLHRVRSPYNVSSPAIAAGVAALADEQYVERARELNIRNRKRLSDALRSMGFDVPSSATNFIRLKCPEDSRRSAASVAKYLREKRILVRPLVGYGLPDQLRITVGADHEVDALIRAMSDL